jgi:cytochrome c553
MRVFLTTLSLVIFGATAGMAADAAAGKATYDKSCKTCHGADGTATPAIAKMMKVEIKDLKSPEVQGMSSAEVKKLLTDGKGKMKPVPAAAAESDNLVAFIHGLKK